MIIIVFSSDMWSHSGGTTVVDSLDRCFHARSRQRTSENVWQVPHITVLVLRGLSAKFDREVCCQIAGNMAGSP